MSSSKRSHKEPADDVDKQNLFTHVSDFVALSSFLLLGLLSTLHNNITDCDETFNYWEPTHYLSYGSGLQTWEYSPVYALRSYFYLLPMSIASDFLPSMGVGKILIFYILRGCLGVCGSLSLWYFYTGVKKRIGNSDICVMTLIFLVTSTGSFISVTAFIPSAFAMYCMAVAYGAWFHENYFIAVLSVACGVLVGWPFSILVASILALDAIVTRGFIRIFFYGVISLVVWLVPSVLIDWQYFGKPVIASLNIVLYNVFHPEAGPELFGSDPFYFYLLNGFLNFNFILLFALLTPLVVFLASKANTKASPLEILKYLGGMFIHLAFFSYVPHKEERFLFVIYPMLCLSGAIGLKSILDIGRSIIAKCCCSKPRTIVKILACIAILFIVVLSISRTTALRVNYGAPLDVYAEFSNEELVKLDPNVDIDICVGKEWYRFPNHYFFPHPKQRLRFIRNAFRGLLPQYFAEKNGTMAIPEHMNNMNRDEPALYVNIDVCDYLIDVDLPSQVENHYLGHSNWTTIVSMPFIDGLSSPQLHRVFWTPLSTKHNVFGQYVVLKRVKQT